jgi:hypothetical protein
MRVLTAIATLSLITASSAPALAARPVGLGVAAGIAIPTKGELSIDPAFAWGFYTDIPLISSFHVTPSTTIYRIDPSTGAGTSVTDISLNFKFMVPLGPLEVFAGLTGGVTSAQDLQPHVGGLIGGALNLISNLDVFLQGNYRLAIADGGNVGTWHIFAGPLIRFTP